MSTPTFTLTLRVKRTQEVVFPNITAAELAEIIELVDYGDGEAVLDRAEDINDLSTDVEVSETEVD